MKTLDRYVLGAGLLVLPFVFSTTGGEQMREPKAHALVVLMGILLSGAVARAISVTLGGAVALVFLSAIRANQFPELAPFGAALGSCLLIAKAKKHDVERGLEILELSGVLCAAYAMLWQYAGLDRIMTMDPGHDFRNVPGFFGQHTLYGPYCVGAFAPALFAKRYFRAALIASPIFAIDSSFTYLSFGVVVATWLIYEHGKGALLALGVAGAIAGPWAAWTLMDTGRREHVEAMNDNGRFVLWGLTMELVRIHPLIGHGTSSFPQQFPLFQIKELREGAGVKDSELSPRAQDFIARATELRRRSGIFQHPHNEFLDVFYEFGALGLALVSMLLCEFWIKFRFSALGVEEWTLAAIFFSFLANSLGNFPFHLIPQALLPLWAFTLVVTGWRRFREEGILRL